jgi:serine/threonine-protein kinase RIM15
MPPRGSFALTGEEMDGDRRFLAALQDLIVLATDVLDTSVNSLASRPSSCTQIIQTLQKVGQNWDEHDEWPGRNWYVDILMAIANLSRVLDWWAAEKGFWNFDEEDDNEPLLFVMKPGKEESRFDHEFKTAISEGRSSPASLPQLIPSTDGAMSAVSLEMLSPDTSAGGGTAKQVTTIALETPKAHGVEDLRFLAEHAKSVNIVMELGLQGEDVQYVNDAIMEVIGYVLYFMRHSS